MPKNPKKKPGTGKTKEEVVTVSGKFCKPLKLSRNRGLDHGTSSQIQHEPVIVTQL